MKRRYIILIVLLLMIPAFLYYWNKSEYHVKLTDHLYLFCDEQGEFHITIDRDISRNMGHDIPGGAVMVRHIQKLSQEPNLFVVGEYIDPPNTKSKWFLINLKTDRPGEVDPEIFETFESLSKSIEQNYGKSVPNLIEASKYWRLK